MKEKKLVGIDFGTCNIKAFVNRGKGNLKPVKLGKKENEGAIKGIRNVILYEKDKENGYKTIIGENAIKKVGEGQKNVIQNIKSHLQEKDWSRMLTFGKQVTALEVVTDIMKKLYQEIYNQNKSAEIFAVITVPVNFSERQKMIVRTGAEKAGFKIKNIITEPFASAFFIMKDYMQEEHHILIFDFGGGTMDLCLVKFSIENENRKIETQASIGIPYGGNHISEDILNKIIYEKYPDSMKDWLEEQENGLRKMVNKNELLQGINEIKEELFQSEEEIDEMEFKEAFCTSKFTLKTDLILKANVKEIYDMLDKEYWKERIFKLLDQLFFSSHEWNQLDITDIFMIGGSSSIPYFRKILEEYFKENENDLFALNDELTEEMEEEFLFTSVGKGAALYNELISDKNENIEIKENIPFAIYIDDREKIGKADSFDFYASPVDYLTEEMKKEQKIHVYQKIIGETEEMVYIGFFPLKEEICQETEKFYRLRVSAEKGIIAEIGYFNEEDEFIYDDKVELSI